MDNTNIIIAYHNQKTPDGKIWMRIAKIRPIGFWTDVITVTQDTNLRTGKWDEPEVKWSCGGTDGTLSNIEVTENFITGLQEAVKISQTWQDEGEI